MREMFANKEFRKALSLGINRKEIIDLVYLGQSEPYQTGPRPGHPWYHEKLARQFTDFDARPGQRHSRQARLRQEGRAGHPAAAGRAEGLLRHRRDPDALSGSRSTRSNW